jgi:hypothetical protein
LGGHFQRFVRWTSHVHQESCQFLVRHTATMPGRF